MNDRIQLDHLNCALYGSRMPIIARSLNVIFSYNIAVCLQTNDQGKVA